MTDKRHGVSFGAGSADAFVELQITHGVGLHARPSVTFTRLAKTFPCSIEIEVNRSGLWLNAKSIVKVMGARIRKGSTLRIRAHGLRAHEAISVLEALFMTDFGEERPHVRGA
ncbi:HPr family phosphocarrier protein [Pararhizobium sp. BT-229]|jgi:phosphocarrier protein HPr|uniref:HPr family phosphocarrier protein n=1 Tax=Pararhizobium sp. BT-229 TaxID=2986923 RepID=UPI0021F6A30A|nr:HPr family phosphocarrier protein [Pararhizobium sp. BT-229]MCV9966621.1 HPr family phosphocarrier protein [Pararhizobium sp. BT-229]